MNYVFDSSVFIYSHYHILKTIGGDISPKAVAQGIEKQMGRIVLELKLGQPKEILIAFDHEEECFRKKIDPQYKANREYSLPFQKSEVHEHMSYDTLRHPGMEADDLMFLYSRKYPGTIIVTDDSDQIQNVDDNTRVYLYKKKLLLDLGNSNPAVSLFEKILLGDKGDNIPKCVATGKLKLNKIPELLKLKGVQHVLTLYQNQLDLDRYLLNSALIQYDFKLYQEYFFDFAKIYDSI